MKKWILTAAVALAGCAQIPNYQSAVKTPPPAELVGNWQSMGPQKGLVSKEATASLIITPQGDTLDCRQWQRVIAKPGKITQFSGDWVNVNNEVRVMPLRREGQTLRYDKLVLQKVQQPTAECREALQREQDKATAPETVKTSAGAKSGKEHHKATMKGGKL